MSGRILIVDDEEKIQKLFSRILSDQGFDVEGVTTYDAALEVLGETPFDLVVSDIMLGDQTGLDLLKAAQEQKYSAHFIMVTGFPSLKSAQEAIRYGAFDYLTKPVLKEALVRAVNSALKYKAIKDEKIQLRTNLEAIFRSVNDTIVTVDGNFNLLEVNEAANHLCHINYSKIGEPFATLDSHCQGQCTEILRQVFHTKKRVINQRIECHRYDKPSQIVKIAASPLISSEGKFSGAVMVVNDETKLISMEKALEEHRQFHRLIGRSNSMQSIFSLIEDLADVETTVLITGESGTGKELVAEAIHNEGGRKGRPFVRVNCAALTESLLESELFGHIKGSFTGAVKDRIGRFQLADKGTIFLDEIGDISSGMQVRLLRVLQEKQFERVGDTKTINVDVRVVAATHQDLQKLISAGKFREDLFYRLKVMTVPIPPLRSRRDDISVLIDHFIKHFNTKFNKQIEAVSESVMHLFMNHSWPGNVRELEHAIEHAFVVCRNRVIEPENLPADFQRVANSEGFPETQTSQPGSEEEAIHQALQKTNWRREEAAKLLGMGRSTFFRKIKKYGINKKRQEE
jgi:two-component system, NtrC family, response regulator HydG